VPEHRVLIDGYYLGKPGGFGRFIAELCRALGSSPMYNLTFVVAVPARRNQAMLPIYPNLVWHKLPNVNLIIWEQILIPRLARSLRCSLIHFPYNTRAISTGGIPTITTVHDVIFLSQSVSLRDIRVRISLEYAKWIFNFATRKSDVVVSVSDATRSALTNLGLNAFTVYPTVDGFVMQEPEQCEHRAGTIERYILHRGGYQPHRNTERVIIAFRSAKSALPNVVLKIVGVPDGAKKWRTHGDDSIQFMPSLTDAQLAGLYEGSACVVVASLQEGFGLPIIEGFGFGTPVITSDLDPMREIAQNAALLIDPYSVTAIEEAMISLLSNQTLADSLVAKGRQRSAHFSSMLVAEKMLWIYQHCLTNRLSG
jgi:glycosyltransferase involved in cell wall biosynthesis